MKTKYSEKGFDVIGDVHGEFEMLVRLLTELGYRPVSHLPRTGLETATWMHDTRTAVFVGDPSRSRLRPLAGSQGEAKRTATALGSGERRKADHFEGPSAPIRSTQRQPTAFRSRAAVVSKMLVSPASIRCSVRMFKSTRSASCSCVISRAIRSRRKLPPKERRSRVRAVDLGTAHHAASPILTERHDTP